MLLLNYSTNYTELTSSRKPPEHRSPTEESIYRESCTQWRHFFSVRLGLFEPAGPKLLQKKQILSSHCSVVPQFWRSSIIDIMKALPHAMPVGMPTAASRHVKPTDDSFKTQDAPLKQTESAVWGCVAHPSGGVSSASTACGSSTISDSATARGMNSSFTALSSVDSNDQLTPSSRGGTPSTSRRQYVAILQGAPSGQSSRETLSTSLATAEASPSWSQYQTSSTGAVTPVYCSLTPPRTTFQLGVAQVEGDGGQTQSVQERSSREVPSNGHSPSVNDMPQPQQDGLVAGRRKSSLILHETPLQVQSLPEEVQAAIQSMALPQGPPPVSLPDWFDPEAGCIRRECLPELPTFRSTLNTLTAKLSIASRVHHRTRWPGEPANAIPSEYQLHKNSGIRRISFPDNTLLRRKSDSALGSGLTAIPQASAHHREHRQDSLDSKASEGLHSRHRRVRFATLATASEYKGRSPSLLSGTPTCSGPSPPSGKRSPEDTNREAKGLTDQQTQSMQTLRSQQAAEAHASDILRDMTEMIRRLLDYPELQQHKQSVVSGGRRFSGYVKRLVDVMLR